MTPQDTLSEKSASSADEAGLTVVWDEPEKRVEIKPLLQNSAASDSVSLFSELAERILYLLDRASGMAEVRDEPESVQVKNLISDYLDRLKERLTEKTASSASPLVREIDYDARALFGLSKASVREVWDNEEDEFWNDV